MKRTILTLTIAAALLATTPVVHAFDRYEDLQSDVHSLWEWYGHLRDEANTHGAHHAQDELEAIRGNLKNVEDKIRDHHYGEHVRGEIEGIRDNLRHVNGELKWHGEVHHREGFTIEIR